MARTEFKYTNYDITDDDVLYEDNHLIAINKRAGDIVQVDDTGDESLDDKVKKYIAKKIQQTKRCVFRRSAQARQTGERRDPFR